MCNLSVTECLKGDVPKPQPHSSICSLPLRAAKEQEGSQASLNIRPSTSAIPRASETNPNEIRKGQRIQYLKTERNCMIKTEGA